MELGIDGWLVPISVLRSVLCKGVRVNSVFDKGDFSMNKRSLCLQEGWPIAFMYPIMLCALVGTNESGFLCVLVDVKKISGPMMYGLFCAKLFSQHCAKPCCLIKVSLFSTTMKSGTQ